MVKKHLIKPGDKGKAVCTDCAALVATTYKYRDVPFRDRPDVVVKGILVGCCDSCDRVVLIPAQSTPAIGATLRQADKPLEMNLPANEFDILDAIAQVIDGHAVPRARKALFGYYLNKVAIDEEGIAKLVEGAKAIADETNALRKKIADLGIEIPRRRLSMKLTDAMDGRLAIVAERTGLTKTDVGRGIVALANIDILQARVPDPDIINDLRVMSQI